ncbi:hypothetical protein OS493_000497 [Desmophyllum pertusum]|uniref:Uncharacterized protein n=1 Tax=Desmophyllum pertusum TaxID=174260 RepID=A0A9X0DCK1_9CNID|nr:hypothetical protein OS493_000497 [Desmophyllum pertusum]
MTARMNGRQVNLTLIQCSDNNTKATFYDQLQAEIEALEPCHDLLIVFSRSQCKMRRGADIGSDRHLVTAYVKRSTGHKAPGNRCFYTERLQGPIVKSAFITQPEKQIPSPESIKTCLRFKETRKRKKWITQGTWRAIKNRRDLKKKLTHRC